MQALIEFTQFTRPCLNNWFIHSNLEKYSLFYQTENGPVKVHGTFFLFKRAKQCLETSE